MKAEDWTYQGEGGKHAIFVRRRQSSSSPEGRQDVLRVRKQDLAQSVTFSFVSSKIVTPSFNHQHHDHLHQTTDDYHSTHRFLQAIRCETSDKSTTTNTVGLSDVYLDRPDVVKLSWTFLRDLREQAIESGRIPPSRVVNWFVNCSKNDKCTTNDKEKDENSGGRTASLSTETPLGLILPDYRFLDPTTMTTAPAVSLEIKPKGGYLAFSPLVHPSRRIKYQRSRFTLLQQLWNQGVFQKNWDCANTTSEVIAKRFMSRYEPLDLFSMQRAQIQGALDSLLETPQNNCKLWLDGKESLPAKPSENGDKTPWSRCVDRDLHLWCGCFSDICAEILLFEPFLSQVAKLQLLDILDADGAIRVYQHLVHRLCDGSVEMAEQLVDRYVAHGKTLERGTPPHPLLASSPLVSPADASRIASLCHLAQQTQEICLNNVGDHEWDDKNSLLDSLHEKALQVVSELNVDDCVYLLQNWLLSLTMNDISFFLTLTDAGTTVEENQILLQGDEAMSKIHLASQQTKDAPGVVAIQSECDSGSDETGQRLIHYRIKVIDCDPKPAKKLRDRETKEELFSCLAK